MPQASHKALRHRLEHTMLMEALVLPRAMYDAEIWAPRTHAHLRPVAGMLDAMAARAAGVDPERRKAKRLRPEELRLLAGERAKPMWTHLRKRLLLHLPRFVRTLTGAAQVFVAATPGGGAWAAAIVQNIRRLDAGFPGLAAARPQDWKVAVFEVYRSVPCDADDGPYAGRRAAAEAARPEERGAAAEAPL